MSTWSAREPKRGPVNGITALIKVFLFREILSIGIFRAVEDVRATRNAQHRGLPDPCGWRCRFCQFGDRREVRQGLRTCPEDWLDGEGK